jgi:hypothetical protein
LLAGDPPLARMAGKQLNPQIKTPVLRVIYFKTSV